VRSALLFSVSFSTLLVGMSANAAEPFDWSGFYAGLGLGGVVVSDAHTDVGPLASSSYSDSGQGFAGSANLGYNWQQGQLVFGVEALAGFLSARATGTDTANNLITTTTFGGLVGLEGRLGFAIDRLLVYGGGGIAAGQVTIADNTGSSTNFGLPNSGWRAAAIGTLGAEYAVTDKVSIKGDLSVVKFQDISTAGTGGYSMTSAPSAAIAQVGVNFHF